jgi:hypothetical protein
MILPALQQALTSDDSRKPAGESRIYRLSGAGR